MRQLFISGISSGIGRALADWFSRRGDRVFGCARRTTHFPESNVYYQQIDLSQLPSLEVQLDRLFDQCPAFEIAILNAAALGEIGQLGGTDLDILQRQMDINLWSQKIVIDKLLEHSPGVQQIISISSGAALKGEAGWNGYSISKAALKMMIEIYAQENPRTHFVSLAPGLVDTEMQDLLGQQVSNNALHTIQPVARLKLQGLISTPQCFAEKFGGILPALARLESGSFVDIRQLEDSLPREEIQP